MSSAIFSLILLITAVWAMIFVGLAAIFLFVVPIPDVISEYVGIFFSSVLQVLISGALAMLWLISIWQLRNYYVHKKILNLSDKE